MGATTGKPIQQPARVPTQPAQANKGPGLPMPNNRMGGQQPYQPVGANNGPFHQNPVAPVQQPIQQMPPQGKGSLVAPQQPGQQAPVGLGSLINQLPPGQQMPVGAKGGASMPPVQPGQMPQGKGPGVANPMNQPGMGPMGPTGPGTFQ
jgi:hypothetical protein